MSADWISRDWGSGLKTVAWQRMGRDALEDLGLSMEQAKHAAWWIDDSGRPFKGHRAIAKSLLACSGWKRVAGAVLSIPPASWVAAAIYPLVVRYRHRLPGGTPACANPQRDEQASTGAE